jgi:hypothetical protein
MYGKPGSHVFSLILTARESLSGLTHEADFNSNNVFYGLATRVSTNWDMDFRRTHELLFMY